MLILYKESDSFIKHIIKPKMREFMRRKVIQIANSTQLVALPRKWALSHGVKKGDELELEEDDNKVIVSIGKERSLEKIEIDITGLDRSSIMSTIRSLYKAGYDIIKINFKESLTQYLRKQHMKKVISVIHNEVNRLIGFEIVEQKESSCTIKMVSSIDPVEYDSIIKRIFLMVVDSMDTFIKGIKDKAVLETIKEKHYTITKFTTYCLRMLNMKGNYALSKTHSAFHVLSNINTIASIIRYCCDTVRGKNLSFSKEFLEDVKKAFDCLKIFHDMYYDFSKKKLSEFNKLRSEIIIFMEGEASSEEILILFRLEQALEILYELTEVVISFKEKNGENPKH